jgi:hypothetical protein
MTAARPHLARSGGKVLFYGRGGKSAILLQDGKFMMPAVRYLNLFHDHPASVPAPRAVRVRKPTERHQA